MYCNFITSKEQLVAKCPECKNQTLFEVGSQTIDMSCDEFGNLKDDIWRIGNRDIECDSCKYSSIVYSHVGSRYSIKKCFKGEYKGSMLDSFIRQSVDYVNGFTKEEILHSPAFGSKTLNEHEYPKQRSGLEMMMDGPKKQMNRGGCNEYKAQQFEQPITCNLPIVPETQEDRNLQKYGLRKPYLIDRAMQGIEDLFFR